jgi:RimJ/RimL family protein N-acetyltransferase
MIIADPFGCEVSRHQLRSVALDDAPFIITLRQDATLNMYLHPIDVSPLKQQKFVKAERESASGWYFLIEEKGTHKPVGTISLYHLDNISAEFGRWVVRRQNIAAVLDSAFLLYEFAFEVQGLERVYTLTRDDNLAVVSFHESLGARRVGVRESEFHMNGRSYGAVEQEVTAARWVEELRDRMYSKLQRLNKGVSWNARPSL